MSDPALTWLGHASLRIDSPGGKRIYVDPFLNGNPKCPESELEPERIDILALTHGHSDHTGDAVELAKRFSPQVVCQVELKGWLGKQGAPLDGQLPGLNKGGSQEIAGIRFTLVNAFHSSSSDQGEYLGEACGLVIRFENGTTVYIAGDTCVFGDMQLIGRLYSPDVAVLPIGDHFTMGPDQAALALELLGTKRCIPTHWGTFPLLIGMPDRLAELAPDVDVVRMEPGETVAL